MKGGGVNKKILEDKLWGEAKIFEGHLKKQISFLIAISFFAVILFGCNPNERNIYTELDLKIPGYYVMNKTKKRILVVNTEPKDLSVFGGSDEYYDALWLSNVPEEVALGDVVEFTIKGAVATSYPGLAGIDSISVIPSQKPVGATLLVSQALNKALQSKKVDLNKVVVVKTISYFKETKKWRISLKETSSNLEYLITVIDK